jgi:hypothetical protein
MVDRGDQLLLSIRTSAPMQYRADYLDVFEDGIVVRNPSRFLMKDVRRVRYDQMAQVWVKHRLAFADLLIETRGGDTLVVRGVSKRDAENASALIRERMASGSARSTEEPTTLDIPTQIQKLAELRDLGAITEEEFQSKKRDLLDRM